VEEGDGDWGVDDVPAGSAAVTVQASAEAAASGARRVIGFKRIPWL
jgi:hypothetical protein